MQFSWRIPISDFLNVWPADSDFLSKNYNWQHIQTKIYAKKICVILNITIPPIWTELQIFSHLNNSQNKVLCDWKEEDMYATKHVISHCLQMAMSFP